MGREWVPRRDGIAHRAVSARKVPLPKRRPVIVLRREKSARYRGGKQTRPAGGQKTLVHPLPDRTPRVVLPERQTPATGVPRQPAGQVDHVANRAPQTPATNRPAVGRFTATTLAEVAGHCSPRWSRPRAMGFCRGGSGGRARRGCCGPGAGKSPSRPSSRGRSTRQGRVESSVRSVPRKRCWDAPGRQGSRGW